MTADRRDFLKFGAAGVAAAGLAGGSVVLTASEAAAQAAPASLLRTVLDRGKVLVGTGSTNAPWHFEDDSGKLVGMDITMGQILAKALFDDENAVEFVQ
jgi:polar amino acid transport system substrate-binding protein